MKGLTVNAQLFLFLRVDVIVGGVLFMRKEDWERLGRLKPEDRVNLAVGMSDVCIRVCADGVRDQNPGISEEELIERVRERLEWSKRYQKGKRYRKLFQHV
jgi:hypothetical protein